MLNLGRGTNSGKVTYIENRKQFEARRIQPGDMVFRRYRPLGLPPSRTTARSMISLRKEHTISGSGSSEG